MTSFDKVMNIIRRLRGPGGCPWDIEQTPESLRSNIIEESWELVDAINQHDAEHVREELGDFFLQAVLLSYIYEQEGTFSVDDVLDGLAAKLIRRHPHVFGDVKVADSAEVGTSAKKTDELYRGSPEKPLTSADVLKNWARIKVEQEGRAPKDSILDEVKKGLAPLDRAYQLQKKAAKAGFDWNSADGVLDKVREETEEVTEAIVSEGREHRDDGAVESELGDLLFAAVNLCRFLHVDPAVALQRTNVKFEERFKYVERRMKEHGVPMKPDNLDEMEKLWDEAKKRKGA